MFQASAINTSKPCNSIAPIDHSSGKVINYRKSLWISTALPSSLLALFFSLVESSVFLQHLLDTVEHTSCMLKQKSILQNLCYLEPHVLHSVMLQLDMPLYILLSTMLHSELQVKSMSLSKFRQGGTSIFFKRDHIGLHDNILSVTDS